MPAYAQRQSLERPRERLRALCVAVLVQIGLGVALFRGLEVDIGRSTDVVQRLIAVTLPPRAPPPQPARPKIKRAEPRTSAAAPSPPGGSPGPKPAKASPSVTPIIAVHPSVPPSGGGKGQGPAVGAGIGEGDAGHGNGGGGGGTELEQIAGEITPRDYPRHLGNAGVGGRVGISFTVGVTGRVTGCTVTRSSGIPELDALTCRLIEQRFRYRPSTDRYGRPIPDRVEGEQEWTAG